jgi:hypothetical protein
MLPRDKLKRLLHGHDVFGHADGRLAQDRHGALFPVHCATQPTLTVRLCVIWQSLMMSGAMSNQMGVMGDIAGYAARTAPGHVPPRETAPTARRRPPTIRSGFS